MVMQRELEFRKLFSCNVTQTVAYVAVTLSLAIAGAGAWSLVAGELASGVVLSVALLLATPYRVRPIWARHRVRELFSAGWGFLVQGGLSFVQESADRLIIGRALGTGPLGFYSMAYRLGEMPYWAIGHPVIMVTFPGFARMRERGEDIRSAFLTSLRLVAVLIVPVGVLLSAAAAPLVHALLGDQWIPAIGVIGIMGIWAVVRALAGILAWLLNSLGKSALLAKITALILAPLVPAIIVAATVGGINDVAWVVLVDAVASVAAYAVFIARHGAIPLRDQWAAVRGPVLAAPVAWVGADLMSRLGDDWPPSVTLAATVLTGLAVFAGALAAVDRSILTWMPAQVRRAMEADPV
jgi:lipopolysaccharide exporter